MKRRMSLVAITLAVPLAMALAVTVAQAQSPAPARDNPPSLTLAGTAVIAGVVTDADGKPIRRVAVNIVGDPRAGRTVLTDDAGRFTFTRVAAGEYRVVATKPGWPDAAFGAKRPGRTGGKVVVKDGARVENVSLVMEKGAVITGTVRDQRGQPMPGTSIAVSRLYTGLDGSLASQPMGSYQTTDDRGEYRVYGLPAGEYVVGTSAFFGSMSASRQPSDEEIKEAFERAERAAIAATQPGAGASLPAPAASPRVDYAAVYYPAAANIVDAARIKVAAGEERSGIDLTLVLRAMSSITGQVTGIDSTGAQPDRVEMLLSDHTKGSTLFTGLDADARFAYRSLAPGDYTLVARTSGPNGKSATAMVTLTGKDITGVTLALGSPPTVKGHVVIEGVDGAGVRPSWLSQISIAPTPAQARDFTSPSSARVDANGDFTLIGSLPRRVRFRPVLPPASSGAPPLTLASVTVNGADATDLAIDVSPSEDPGPIVITLTTEMSSLSGTVTKGDGSSASGYFMVAVAADQRYWLWSGRRIQSARTDTDGKYTFKDLPPGVYRIAATTDLETTDLSDRSFIEQIVGASAEVTIAPKEKKTFDLKLGGG